MGAKMFGFRSGKHTNDNLPKMRRADDEVPIKAEDWRSPPVIEREASHRWYCLVTVPQGEYRCADGLSEAGIASYVPTSTQWVRRRKGNDLLRVQTQTPLLRGYVFARLTRAFVENEDTFARKLVLGSDWTRIYERDAYRKNPLGVLGVMSNYGTPSPMPLRDATQGRQGLSDLADDERAGWFNDRLVGALIAGRDAKPEPVVMKHERVRITGGPFAGMEGVAENDNDRTTARITIPGMFGQSAIATISIGDLENLTRPQGLGVAQRRA